MIPFYNSRIIVRLIPRALLKTMSNEILEISKFKLFVSRDKFSRIAQIHLKLANVKHN